MAAKMKLSQDSLGGFPNSLEFKETVLKTNALINSYQQEKDKIYTNA